MRRLTEKLSYANVVASLALFISLSGASYAAITLPANSVGPRQLRQGAVSLGNLRFPIGTVGFTHNNTSNQRSEQLGHTCQQGGVPPPLVPPSGGRTPGREVHVFFPRAGNLIISAIVGLENETTEQTPFLITLELIKDGRPIEGGDATATVASGQTAEVPIQVVTKASAGKHEVGLAVRADSCLKGPSGHIRLTQASLIASASPPAVTHK